MLPSTVARQSAADLADFLAGHPGQAVSSASLHRAPGPPTRTDRHIMLVRGRMTREVALHLECDDAAAIVEDLPRLGYEAGSPALPARPG